MMEPRFTVKTEPFERGIVVQMQGDITKQSEDALLQLIPWEQGLGAGREFLVLDFAAIPYINSAGIATLIRIVRSGVKGGYRTFAYGLSYHYEKLFRMVGLTEFMMIYPDRYAVMQRIAEIG